MARLGDYARTLRSKNAGAFQLTIDVVLKSEDGYHMALRALTPELVAERYQVPVKDVMIIPYPQVCAIKITIPRLIPSGAIGDGDVYGAQQHVPIMMVEIGNSLASEADG